MGLGAQMILWPEGFIESLVRRGYRVIRFDNRDVGLSTKIQAKTEHPRTLIVRSMLGQRVDAPYTLRDMADDAVGLLDHLGIARAHVMGMSMGGMIAQTMAIHHEHRLKTLTSLSSSTGARRHMLSKPKALRALLQGPPANREHAIERTVEIFGVIGGTTHRPDFEWLRDVGGRAYDRSVHPPGFVRQLAAIVASGSRLDALRHVRLPTTVIHGTVDPLLLPSSGVATAAAIRGARFAPIEGMGHDLPRSTWPMVGDELERVRDRV